MALDRIVTWKDVKPTQSDVGTLLEDFFGGAARIAWSAGHGYWFCELTGRNSPPFRRLRDDTVKKAHVHLAEQTPPRIIEVIPCDDHVGIRTGDAADRYTNALAEELAVLLAWGWQGEREPM